MYDWMLTSVNQRHEELRQDREKLLLVRQALEARGQRDPLYAPALAWMGRRFMALGQSLQKRYADGTQQRVAANC